MLVLSRRCGEAIVLPGLDLTVRVVAIKGGVVRLGIDAPQDIRIVREELLAHSPQPSHIVHQPQGDLMPH
jgi:carbon storage regulator